MINVLACVSAALTHNRGEITSIVEIRKSEPRAVHTHNKTGSSEREGGGREVAARMKCIYISVQNDYLGGIAHSPARFEIFFQKSTWYHSLPPEEVEKRG